MCKNKIINCIKKGDSSSVRNAIGFSNNQCHTEQSRSVTPLIGVSLRQAQLDKKNYYLIFEIIPFILSFWFSGAILKAFS